MGPTLIVSVDRTSLTLPPLVMSGSGAGDGSLGITAYEEPAMQARVKYAPESDIVHGDTALGWTWQQTLLVFEVAASGAVSEQAQRQLIAELVAAVTQFPRYSVTVTVDGAPGETWGCDPATVSPVGERSYADLRHHDPAWRVTIPCYPVRTVA